VHTGRLFALTGVVIGIVGLFLKALRTGGEEFLPDLSAASSDFPESIPTIYGGLDTWAQILVVILIIAVVVLAFYGVRAAAMDRNSSLITAVIGAALLAYAVIKMLDANDDAENLEAGFAQAAGAGLLPAVYTVSLGVGFFILIVGTVLVIAGGLSGLRSSDE
jgi:succinate dehydrogenase/fumarate reductase cytochrome b subunit